LLQMKDGDVSQLEEIGDLDWRIDDQGTLRAEPPTTSSPAGVTSKRTAAIGDTSPISTISLLEHSASSITQCSQLWDRACRKSLSPALAVWRVRESATCQTQEPTLRELAPVASSASATPSMPGSDRELGGDVEFRRRLSSGPQQQAQPVSALKLRQQPTPLFSQARGGPADEPVEGQLFRCCAPAFRRPPSLPVVSTCGTTLPDVGLLTQSGRSRSKTCHAEERSIHGGSAFDHRRLSLSEPAELLLRSPPPKPEELPRPHLLEELREAATRRLHMLDGLRKQEPSGRRPAPPASKSRRYS